MVPDRRIERLPPLYESGALPLCLIRHVLSISMRTTSISLQSWTIGGTGVDLNPRLIA
jgi:hypothetical protein